MAFSGYLFAASAWLLILLCGLAGVFTAGLLPAMTSIVGDLAPENRRAQWIGIVSGDASVGWIVVFLIAAALVSMLMLASGLVWRLPAEAIAVGG